jgi:pyruvate,water dikinase
MSREAHSEGTVLVEGIAASPGVVAARVTKLTSPDQVDRLKDGDVLVAVETNPEYTLAILRASAIVTDVGGMLSHPAIVARELGIPGVVGTREATKVLEDGMEVVVDGTKGIVLAKGG